jgi:hypothetical protein
MIVSVELIPPHLFQQLFTGVGLPRVGGKQQQQIEFLRRQIKTFRSKDERYFFTGDLTWALEGFQTPAHKFIISSLLVDKDRNLIGKEIGRVAHLMKLNPEIKIIPAHDFNAFENFKKLK